MADKLSALCMALMRADSEAEVVAILTSAGYWNDTSAWRYLNDNEGNFSSIGNQQSEAIAALIEKVVNGVDSRLMNACWESGIDPTSPSAPRSIRDAVARFFEDKNDATTEQDGRISTWLPDKATNEGRLLTLAATGAMPLDGNPSISIADQGEGQEPDRFPDTFLSLNRSNKLRVHFVQGKFNMGGTGALQFCSGEHKLQLIVSRRNPALLRPGASSRATEWGFTIVRKEWPKDGSRSSVFTYLAPVGASPTSHGEVLSFKAPSWPIFPEADTKIRDAYARHAEYGSLIKLYEYHWQGNRSNIVSSRNGLLRRLDSGLPELALPVRIFECRTGYHGHSGSFATNVLGLAARLDKKQDKADNLEPGFPVGGVINLHGCQVKVRVYALKPKKAPEYRTPRQGVIFTVNGQSHATFPTDFFRRKAVGMSYLADSLLVLVDCSGIEGQMREDLFMNSRDRLRDMPLALSLEQEIELFLHADTTLKALRNTRREAELADKLEDSKPLTDVLQSILKSSPTLAKLFLLGIKLPSPFPPAAGTGEGSSDTFIGKTYPTFFRFRGMKDGEVLVRDAHLESRTRVAFETDAADDYLIRELDAGALRVLLTRGEHEEEEVTDWSTPGPHGGILGLSIISLPEGTKVGDELTYRIEMTDDSRIEAFSNQLTLRVRKAVSHTGGGNGPSPSAPNSGRGNDGGPSTLQLPNIKEVHEAEWGTYGHNEFSALTIINAGQSDAAAAGSATDVFDFFVNVDNKFLRIMQKESKDDPNLIKAKFIYGLVLVGLALLQEDRVTPRPKLEDGDEDVTPDIEANVEANVERMTRALGPVLLPMLQSIGSLTVGEDD